MKKTKNYESNLLLIKSKLSMLEGMENYPLSIEYGNDEQDDWVSIRLGNISVCGGDTEWILIPGKLEMHLFDAGRRMSEDDIMKNYTLTKKEND